MCMNVCIYQNKDTIISILWEMSWYVTCLSQSHLWRCWGHIKLAWRTHPEWQKEGLPLLSGFYRLGSALPWGRWSDILAHSAAWWFNMVQSWIIPWKRWKKGMTKRSSSGKMHKTKLKAPSVQHHSDRGLGWIMTRAHLPRRLPREVDLLPGYLLHPQPRLGACIMIPTPVWDQQKSWKTAGPRIMVLGDCEISQKILETMKKLESHHIPQQLPGIKTTCLSSWASDSARGVEGPERSPCTKWMLRVGMISIFISLDILSGFIFTSSFKTTMDICSLFIIKKS